MDFYSPQVIWDFLDNKSCPDPISTIKDVQYDLQLFPNPTHDQIIIVIKGYNGPVNVDLYDLQGRLLETTNSTTLSLRKYERGIYIFKIRYEEITEEVRVLRD